jgi:LmbE family N-acetylglucosaminyl deacetylase
MKILVIAAHMDDEILGMGGTIAKHVSAGHEVTVFVAAKRAYNHQFDQQLIQEEKQAAKEAAEILGYRHIHFLDLRDELLDERLLDLIDPIEELVIKLQPGIVYTHHRGDSNQDHRAVCHASMVACRSTCRFKVPRVLTYEVPSSTDIAPPFPEYAFQPNFYVNIEPFLEKKQKAIQAYKREIREFPHPRSTKGVEVLAQKRGMEVGLPAAEGFMVIRDEWL